MECALKHKKFLREQVGQPADRYLIETSFFGPELRPPCRVVVEGPVPVHRWYARVTVDAQGLITEVQ